MEEDLVAANETQKFLSQGKKAFSFGKTEFFDDIGALFFYSPNRGKRLPNEFISYSKKGAVDFVFFDHTGRVNIMADLDLRNLEALVKAIKARKRDFKKRNAKRKKEGLKPITFFFVHLNPEISFKVAVS